MERKILFLVFLAVLTIGGLVTVSVVHLVYRPRHVANVMISEDIKQLHDIFKRIHKECHIFSFDYQRNPINFLNVTKFSGSEVGPMNLAYPNNWEGPYVTDNPTIQGKEYQVVDTYKGYYITPGDGVELANGMVVGKDIVLDNKQDIDALIVDNGPLNFKGAALAIKLTID